MPESAFLFCLTNSIFPKSKNPGIELPGIYTSQLVMALSSFRKSYTLHTYTGDSFLLIAREAAHHLGWTVSQLDQTGLLAYAPAGENTVGDEIRITLDDDKAMLTSESMTGTANEQRHQQNIEKLVTVLDELQTRVSAEEINQQLAQQPSAQWVDESAEKKSGFFSFFIPSGDYFITPILINLNILVFLVMMISGVGIFDPDTQDLIRWGANFKPYTIDNQWWRLFTSTFLHIGLFHLAMNMYALVFIGSILEPLLGRMRFLIAYVCSGILASVASLWWHDTTVSAGASGAIFGMYGVFLALLTTNYIEKEARKALLSSISIFVVYNLIAGLRGGVDNAAHIGGLVSGMLMGYAFYPKLQYPEKSILGMASIAGILLATAGISLIAVQFVSDPIGEYDRRMEEFYTRQTAALKIYNLPENTPTEKILVSIKDSGLVNWKENLKLVKELDHLNLPEVIRGQNKKLIEYCELRIKSYELMYKAFNENTQAYEPQIEVYDRRIEGIINDLNKKDTK